MSGPQPSSEPRPTGESPRSVSTVHTSAFRDGSAVASGFPVDEVSDHLARPDTVVWIDFSRPTTAQFDALAVELGLHDLAVEDALESHQRPKLDYYQSHLFLSCYTVRVDPGRGGLDGTRIDAFIGDRWLVTVRQNEEFPLEPLLARCDRSPDLARHGVSFLLYALLDEVVESYFDVVAAFDDFYEEVSEGIFRDEPLDPARQRNWFEMRQALQRFHRLVAPMREVVNGVMRRDHGVVPTELYPYYQDVYDHILRVVESIDALRELVSTIVETNLSLRDYRQNQIMKKVTSWAAIIAVPTLVTGYYGMNVPYPGFARHWGFMLSTVLMAICSLTLYVIFKRRDWL